MSIAVPATDNIAVTKVELYIDGQLKAQTNMSELSCCWHSRNAAFGFPLNLTRAFDVAGNQTLSSVQVNTITSDKGKKGRIYI